MTRPRWRTGRPWRRLCDQVRREETHCWLCHRPLVPDAPARTPWATEAHHLVSPLDRPDLALIRSNVHATHRLCNQRAGRPSLPGKQAKGSSAALGASREW